MSQAATQIAFISRFGAVIFIIAKVLRFAFFLLFLILIQTKTQGIANYSLWQIIFFYATFNIIDTVPQFLWREVYRFRAHVISGNFDYFLTKPISPLFRSLFGGSDILDVPMIILSTIFVFATVTKVEVNDFTSIIIYVVLMLNAFLVALSLHIIVLCVGVLTTEVDNTIMLYRDLTQMGRVPVDVYREVLSFILTFVVPIGIMMTFPAKALLGLLSGEWIVFSFVISTILFLLSLIFWRYSLKNYTSVST